MNQAQEIQFQRLKMGSFNSFDGERTAAELKKHKSLWTGFVFGRFNYGSLIELRDISQDYLNADTLMI